MDNSTPLDITAATKHYFMDIFYAFPIKAAIATVLSFFVDALGGVKEVLYCYVALMTTDLIFGVLSGIAYKNFSFRKIHRWMIKVLVQFVVAGVISLFFYMFYKTSGTMIAVVNWIFIMYAFTDLASILEKMEQLGIKLPGPTKIIVGMLRKKASQHIANLFDDPEAAEQIENALVEKQTKKKRRQKQVQNKVQELANG